VILRLLHRRRWLIAALALSTLVGVFCTKLNTAGNLTIGTAESHMLVDDPDVSILERRAFPQDLATLENRAELYGTLMTTPPVLDAIARRAHLPRGQISGLTRTTANVPMTLTQPGSEERASQIRHSEAPYRLELQSDPFQPVLAIYAQAPTLDEALRLANSAEPGLEDYLRDLARSQGADPRVMPRLLQLGAARGAVTGNHAKLMIGGLTFGTAFVICLALLLGLGRLRRRRTRVRRPVFEGGLGDWPRTTRLLPWSIAVLITMCWLVPFDRIELNIPAPIDLTLDRLVLPTIAVIWVLALLSGRAVAPRLRLTPVHLALGGVLACAFLSVVIDARYLNQTAELMLAFKKLPLLVSYASVFVIVASSVRRSEVPAFLNYTLVLAVICGLGVIFEYRTHNNPFLTLSHVIFHSPFEVTLVNDGALDSLGRRWIQGPTAYGVELIALMSMALPIAILGILRSTSLRRKLLYVFAITVILAAVFATQRKSAMIAPVAAVAALAYFRRRELLSLAPLGLALGVVVSFISPGAVHDVLSQFLRSDATQVATVSDRTADYDAIRPDVWAHLLIGRGHGSYNHDTYRVLDSEILMRLIETGVLGLAAFVFVPIAVILFARRTVSERHPRWAPAALCGVAAAVCFLVISTLYDVMSVPHAPDVFLIMAGLAVAVVAEPDSPPPRLVRERGDIGREPEDVVAPAAGDAEVLAGAGRW
jgi:O-Antigen ligase